MSALSRTALTSVVALTLAIASTARGQELASVAKIELGDDKKSQHMIALDPDGRFLAVGRWTIDKWTVQVWDLAGPKELGTIEGAGRFVRLQAMAVSSAPLRIAIVGGDGIGFWHWNSAAKSFVRAEGGIPAEPYRGMSFSSDGKRLAFADAGCSLIDVDARKLVHTFRPPVPAWTNALSPDLSLIAQANHQDVDLYSMETGKSAGSLLDHCGNVGNMAFRPDGKALAVGATRTDGRYKNAVSEIKIWGLDTLKENATTKEIPGWIGPLVHPSDRVLCTYWSADLDALGELRLFDVRAGKWTSAIAIKTRRGRLQFEMSPVGIIALASEGIQVWRVVSPK